MELEFLESCGGLNQIMELEFLERRCGQSGTYLLLPRLEYSVSSLIELVSEGEQVYFRVSGRRLCKFLAPRAARFPYSPYSSRSSRCWRHRKPHPTLQRTNIQPRTMPSQSRPARITVHTQIQKVKLSEDRKTVQPPRKEPRLSVGMAATASAKAEEERARTMGEWRSGFSKFRYLGDDNGAISSYVHSQAGFSL